MTREDIIRELQALASAREQRVEIWRVIVDETGKEIGRMYRGSFNAPPGSHIGEPRSQGEPK